MRNLMSVSCCEVCALEGKLKVYFTRVGSTVVHQETAKENGDEGRTTQW
jgi:hypothetical protein